MLATPDVEISPDLQQFFLRTETACVRECCGLDAFEPDATIIGAWATEAGHTRASSVLRELQALTLRAEDRNTVFLSSFLNACTPTEESRQKLLSFLRSYEAELRVCV